jgi:hypothetical protein
MISVPAVIHLNILGLLAWHYYDKTVRFIQSVPKRDYAADEPWAMECRKELATGHSISTETVAAVEATGNR